MPKQKTNKEEILAQAYQVFKALGYHRAKISDLAQACGLEKSHFYYYFKDKQDLMAEVLRFASGKMREWVWSKAYGEGYTAEQRFRKVLDNLLKVHSLHGGGCIMGHTALEVGEGEPELRQEVQAYFDEAREAFTHLYGARFPEERARELAGMALRELQGAIILMRLYQDPRHFEEAVAQIGRRFFEFQPVS
jgi:TetR/AcrR family transcriptional repressor of nem operon